MMRLGLILALTGPLVLAGCKQDAGERCQIDSDCGGGLLCCPPGAREGTCHADCTGGGEGEAEAEAEGEDAGPADAPAPDLADGSTTDVAADSAAD